MSKEKFSIGSETVIGMVHCLPLPTTAGFDGDYQKILDRAVQDAVTLEKAGVDAVIVENMGDTPFSALLNKAQLAALTAATLAVKNAVNIPVGVDAAFNDCEANIAIAAITGASFIRVPVFVDTVIFTDGVINPCAKKCMEYRKAMGKEDIKVLADVQVKHAHMVLPYITVEQSAKEAVDSGADGINGNPDWRGNTAGSDQASKKCSKSAGICRKRCESREYQRSAADCRWCDHRIQPERRRDYQQSDFL